MIVLRVQQDTRNVNAAMRITILSSGVLALWSPSSLLVSGDFSSLFRLMTMKLGHEVEGQLHGPDSDRVLCRSQDLVVEG